MPDRREEVAHVLRRTTFGPFPGVTERMAGRGPAAAIEAVLAAAPLVPDMPTLTEDAEETADGPAATWLRLMANPAAGIHEKMVWFWHGHLTSSFNKVDTWEMMWRQHLLLREHALGNFRDLMRAVTVDAAMLQFLDGDGSTADAPNENYARELMELFTLGRGNYSQQDVRGAATALAGWSVDYPDPTVSFDPDDGNTAPVRLLGRTVTTAENVVDAVCRHPACARFVTAKLYRYLVGVDPPADRLGGLAQIFTESGLEIRPVVEAIVRDGAFLAARLTRPRFPVEWVTAALALCGIDDPVTAYECLDALGQVPFYPPSVAGWPTGTQWLSASHAVVRAALAVEAPALSAVASAPDPVTAAFELAAIYSPSPGTRSAAEGLASALRREDPDTRASALLALVVCSPEFALA